MLSPLFLSWWGFSLSQDRFRVVVVSNRRGCGFQIRWPWVSDRRGRGFKLSFGLWDFGGRGVMWLCVVVGFAHRGPSWVWWVLLAVATVGLGFNGSCSPLYPPPPSLWGFSLKFSLFVCFSFFLGYRVDFWKDADCGGSGFVVGLGLLLTDDGWLYCVERWMLMGLGLPWV